MRDIARSVLVVFAIAAAMAGPLRANDAANGASAADRGSVSVHARVRSTDASMRALIQHASELSTTFRALVQTIEGSDGIVFVEPGDCGHRRVRSCLLHAVTVAGAYRILHIRVRANERDENLMGLVGHELQHAVEVLGEPRLRSGAAIYLFYLQTNDPRRLGESQAAIDTGHQVSREVRSQMRAGGQR